jgi:hypothetical protein
LPSPPAFPRAFNCYVNIASLRVNDILSSSILSRGKSILGIPLLSLGRSGIGNDRELRRHM